MPSQERLRILLADDHGVLRESLQLLLEAQADVDVVGVCGNGTEAVALAESLSPDVIFMDVTMPGMNGIEATRAMRRTSPSTKVIILSSFGDADLVRQAVAAGASGYIIKRADIRELLFGLKSVMTGNTYFSADLAGRIDVGQLVYEARSGESRSALDRLTPREREVVRMFAEGHTARDIGDRLFISARTVESHKTRAQEKLDIHNRAELVRFAIRSGLVRFEGPESESVDAQPSGGETPA